MEDEEEDDHWQSGQGGSGKDNAVIGGEFSLQARDPYGQSIGGRVAQGDQRPEEVVPVLDEGEDGQSANRGFAQRKYDVPEDTPFTAAIDARRVQKFAGQRLDILAHQENTKSAGHAWQDKRPQRVQDMYIAGNEIERYHGDVRGNHHGRDQHPEENGTPGEALLGKGIARQGIKKHVEKRNAQGNNEAIAHPVPIIRSLAEQTLKIGEAEVERQDVWRRLQRKKRGRDGGDKEPVERPDRNNPCNSQSDPGAPGNAFASAFACCGWRGNSHCHH